MASLEEILRSRDERASRQRELKDSFTGKALLSLTVIVPGPEKRTETSLNVAAAAVSAIRDAFHIVHEELRDLSTGYEAFFIVPGDDYDAKRKAVEIEETHPFGRLFDIDVIGQEGPLSRKDVGAEERRCLICGKTARECMRLRTHSPEELTEAVRRIVTRR
ncbi:MAG: citrate lyase holo-[acyl-carrier protein] synthase [Bacteroidales bacterium]|nr:citrate lyase holo-[acyl-carrier protein] synthase [Bacteroidales bacterium]